MLARVRGGDAGGGAGRCGIEDEVFEEAFEILMKGGPVMAPIVGVSVAAWALVFAHAMFLRREAFMVSEFLWRLETRLHAAGCRSALNLCRETDHPLASALLGLFSPVAPSRNRRRAIVARAVEFQRDRTAGRLQVLAALASSATLLGLLGTVAGMIGSFTAVRMHGTGEPSLLAGGISQALITTEAGLVVALPLVLAHGYLASRAERAVVDVHRKLLDISAGMGAAGDARGEAGAGGGL